MMTDFFFFFFNTSYYDVIEISLMLLRDIHETLFVF